MSEGLAAPQDRNHRLPQCLSHLLYRLESLFRDWLFVAMRIDVTGPALHEEASRTGLLRLDITLHRAWIVGAIKIVVRSEHAGVAGEVHQHGTQLSFCIGDLQHWSWAASHVA